MFKRLKAALTNPDMYSLKTVIRKNFVRLWLWSFLISSPYLAMQVYAFVYMYSFAGVDDVPLVQKYQSELFFAVNGVSNDFYELSQYPFVKTTPMQVHKKGFLFHYSDVLFEYQKYENVKLCRLYSFAPFGMIEHSYCVEFSRKASAEIEGRPYLISHRIVGENKIYHLSLKGFGNGYIYNPRFINYDQRPTK